MLVILLALALPATSVSPSQALESYLCRPALEAEADLGQQAVFVDPFDQPVVPDPAGLDRIIDQIPPGGAALAPQGEVKFRVVESAALPNFAGATVAEVLAQLECYGWQLEIHEPDGSVRPVDPEDHESTVSQNAPTSIAHQPLDIGGTVGVILVPPPASSAIVYGLGAATGLAAAALIMWLRGARAGRQGPGRSAATRPSAR